MAPLYVNTNNMETNNTIGGDAISIPKKDVSNNAAISMADK
jgi:hypothetical protein